MSELNVYQRLLAAQKEIVAPRDVVGRFGKGRSAEKVLEAVKPVLQKHGLLLHTSDKLERFGERNYITVTARVINVEKPDEFVESTASAWENEVSVGLDTSQVSGKTSSYGKKYALQNLFAIDDTKDADVEHTDPEPKKSFSATPKQLETLLSLAKNEGASNKDEAVAHIEELAGCKLTELSSAMASKLISELMK